MITWTISQMERKADDGFVVRVWYRVDAKDGDITSAATGSCDYTQSSDSFVPYDQLTQDQVIGWIKDTLGTDNVTNIEANLEAQILEKKQVELGLPWTNTGVTP